MKLINLRSMIISCWIMILLNHLLPNRVYIFLSNCYLSTIFNNNTIQFINFRAIINNLLSDFDSVKLSISD